MTAELSSDDLAAMRKTHRESVSYGVANGWCVTDCQKWPCDAVRLLDEVERLRGDGVQTCGAMDG